MCESLLEVSLGEHLIEDGCEALNPENWRSDRTIRPVSIGLSYDSKAR